VELTEPNAGGCQVIQVRRLDLTSVAAKIGVAYVIRDDQDNVRPLRCSSLQCTDSNDQQQCHTDT
jgi:hypothetical protein